MQILHPFAGSPQQYLAQLDDPDQHRPGHCPQCQAKRPLTAHGFYARTLVDSDFDGTIRVRRYLCKLCGRTVSLLPQFALPYLRSSVGVIALWLLLRLSPPSDRPAPPPMPYQRGQFWVRRFRSHAAALCAALALLAKPAAAGDFVRRALSMLESAGWIPAHRFLFGDVRDHLLGWPPSLIPDGRRVTLGPVAAPL
jgi:transposase-like protein